jgi:hypothetical protein
MREAREARHGWRFLLAFWTLTTFAGLAGAVLVTIIASRPLSCFLDWP